MTDGTASEIVYDLLIRYTAGLAESFDIATYPDSPERERPSLIEAARKVAKAARHHNSRLVEQRQFLRNKKR